MAKKPSKSSKKASTPQPEPELTPKQLKEKKREEARARAAEARKVVTAGTNAWTGKLPAQLLNENCQKLKWQSAEYSIKGSGESFTGIVYLARKDPKTQEVSKVKFEPPKDLFVPQKTPLEARHYAATYVLHRIMSARNLKMMLPPAHRDLWIEMDKIKADAPPQDKWKWEDDPFTAWESYKKRTQERQASHKARQEAEPMKQAIKTAKSAIKQESREEKPDTRIHFNTKLQMSKQLRARIEELLQSRNGFRFDKQLALEKSQLAKLVKVVSDLGFAKFQVEEAFQYTSSVSDCLSWLLVHVPESDLPKMFIPQHLDQSVRVASNLSAESAISKMKDFGFSELVAINAIQTHETLAEAMTYLTNKLINAPIEESGSINGFWEEEIESLQAIYENVETFTDGCTLILQNKLKVYFYNSKSYPASCLGIGLEPNHKVPKYILLDATGRAATFAQDLLGDYMILSIAQWLEDNFDDILKSPCTLLQISAGITGVYEEPLLTAKKPAPSTKTKAIKHRRIDFNAVQEEYNSRFNCNNGEKVLAARSSLPAWGKREEICELVKNNRVVLITGDTGSGKSTQVVQFLLDEAIANHASVKDVNILCTQPRRISAIGVAQRVADERLSKIGEDVGYVIRGENKTSRSTMITFVTSGVLLRMIQSNAAEVLNSITHIFVDEVHERSLDSDFLLILLKRLISKAPHLKVVLMSATVDPALFINYFKPVVGQVGYTHIEGRTFPVHKVYLDKVLGLTQYVPLRLREEGVTSADLGQIITSMRDGVDFRLVAELVGYIDRTLGKEKGSILVFMSGAAEIDRTINAINSCDHSGSFWVIPLHASLSPSDQRLAFKDPPPGKRKVVVSTNVAETSITISDIVAVIDSGRVKEVLYSPEAHVLKLVDSWVSRAAAKQRMGRAGRVREGTCYKLYTENIESDKMVAHPAPEILRCSLDSLYLSVKSMGIGDVETFLASALDPPSQLAVNTAKKNLFSYGALNGKGELTPLGKHISLLPTDPQSGKLLILSAIFGCLTRGLTIAAIIGGKPPTVSPKDKRVEAKTAFKSFCQDDCGDIIAYTRIYEQWCQNVSTMSKKELNRWCSDNFVSHTTCREIQSTKRQLLGILMQSGIVDTDREDKLPDEVVAHDKNDSLVCAIVGGALSPRLIEAVYSKTEYLNTSTGYMEAPRDPSKYLIITPSKERVFLHPGSSLFGVKNLSPYMSYATSIVTTKHFVGGMAPLGVYALLFFSNTIQVDIMGTGIVIDKWTGLKCWPRIGILGKFLKNLFDKLIEKKFETPTLPIASDEVVQCVLELIETDGRGRQ